jgi:hypothetical protein
MKHKMLYNFNLFAIVKDFIASLLSFFAKINVFFTLSLHEFASVALML